MPKYRGITAAVAAVAVIALGPASALGDAGGTDRPMKGTLSGDVTVTLAGLQTTADITGVATHLGRYTGHFEGDAEIIGGTVFGEGTLTLAAANGDQLTGLFTFSGPPPGPEPHLVTGTLTITGGTGRFADASGTLTSPFLATPSCVAAPACPGALVESIDGPVTGLISY